MTKDLIDTPETIEELEAYYGEAYEKRLYSS
jgi:hypothetical protein